MDDHRSHPPGSQLALALSRTAESWPLCLPGILVMAFFLELVAPSTELWAMTGTGLFFLMHGFFVAAVGRSRGLWSEGSCAPNHGGLAILLGTGIGLLLAIPLGFAPRTNELAWLLGVPMAGGLVLLRIWPVIVGAWTFQDSMGRRGLGLIDAVRMTAIPGATLGANVPVAGAYALLGLTPLTLVFLLDPGSQLRLLLKAWLYLGALPYLTIVAFTFAEALWWAQPSTEPHPDLASDGPATASPQLTQLPAQVPEAPVNEPPAPLPGAPPRASDPCEAPEHLGEQRLDETLLVVRFDGQRLSTHVDTREVCQPWLGRKPAGSGPHIDLIFERLELLPGDGSAAAEALPHLRFPLLAPSLDLPPDQVEAAWSCLGAARKEVGRCFGIGRVGSDRFGRTAASWETVEEALEALHNLPGSWLVGRLIEVRGNTPRQVAKAS